MIDENVSQEIKDIVKAINETCENKTCDCPTVTISKVTACTFICAANEYVRKLREPVIPASVDAVAFCKWIMENYDDNGFEELHNRAKDVVENAIPAADIDEAWKALDWSELYTLIPNTKVDKIRYVLNKMRGV